MNLDLLHQGFLDPRLPGKTTRMLVIAAQQADFSVRDVTIVAHTAAYAAQLRDQFLRIAKELDFDPVPVHQRSARIKDTRYDFVSADACSTPPSPAGATFYDNFLGWDGMEITYQDDPPFHLWPTRYPSDWLEDLMTEVDEDHYKKQYLLDPRMDPPENQP